MYRNKVVVLLSVAMAAAEQIKNPNINALLFYTCVTPQIGNQCEEGFTLDQRDIITRGFSSNLTTIAAGKALNITTFFAVHDTFFDNGKGLRKDWKQAWAAMQAELEPLIESRTVVGFFIGDELFPNKISLADFTTALQALQTMKTKYPWLVTWENEGGTTWTDYFKDGLPFELDIISTDDYYMWPGGVNGSQHTPQGQADGHRAFYEQSIYPLLKPHQRVFLVPGSYGTRDAQQHGSGYPLANESYCYPDTAQTAAAVSTVSTVSTVTFDGCDRYMADQANAFAAWAFEDPRVAGIAAWHWDTRKIGVVTPYKEVGVVDLPKTRAAWKAIGKRIRENENENENDKNGEGESQREP